MTRVIYIAGPVTGNDSSWLDFINATVALTGRGYHVYNPRATNPPYDTDTLVDHWVFFMKDGIKKLLLCNTIFMLYGWEDSKGACLEHRIAIDLGYEIHYQSESISPSIIPMSLVNGSPEEQNELKRTKS